MAVRVDQPKVTQCPATDDAPRKQRAPNHGKSWKQFLLATCTVEPNSTTGRSYRSTIKLPRYNGEKPPETYLIQVQLASQLNAWSAEETAVHMLQISIIMPDGGTLSSMPLQEHLHLYAPQTLMAALTEAERVEQVLSIGDRRTNIRHGVCHPQIILLPFLSLKCIWVGWAGQTDYTWTVLLMALHAEPWWIRGPPYRWSVPERYLVSTPRGWRPTKLCITTVTGEHTRMKSEGPLHVTVVDHNISH